MFAPEQGCSKQSPTGPKLATKRFDLERQMFPAEELFQALNGFFILFVLCGGNLSAYVGSLKIDNFCIIPVAGRVHGDV